MLNDWWNWENVNQRVTYALLTEADYDEPKNINEAMDAHLKKAGYTKCSADCCIYVKRLENGKFVFLSLYVDDLLIASNDISILKEEKESLKRAFEMEDQGEIHFCLGMSVKRD